MKRLGLLTFVALHFLHLQGQGVTGSLSAGWALATSFGGYQDSGSYYKNSLQGGPKFGLDVGYMVDRKFSADFSLTYQNTSMPVDARYNGSDYSKTLRVDLMWIQAGGTSYFPANHFEFMFGTHLGVGLYRFLDLPPSKKEAPVRFAWSVRGGMGYLFTERVGMNIRADALFSTDPLREEFATPGLSNGSNGFNYFFQFSFSSGIIIRMFKDPNPKRKK